MTERVLISIALIAVWAALMCALWVHQDRRANRVSKARQRLRDAVMARLIFEHKSGSKLAQPPAFIAKWEHRHDL